MVNDACRRSHEFQDEPRGKPKWVGVHVSERLSSINRGKTSRGKPRSKPESGNPTFRDCRGARGNVTWSLRRGARASALSRLSADYPVGTVVISGDGTGDQAVGSPDVKRPRWLDVSLVCSDRRASKATGRSASEPW